MFSSGWSNCVGTYTDASGRRYVGEWRDGKYDGHGQGAYTHANGRVDEGLWESGFYIDRELARHTQRALQSLGLYSGKLDGIIGRNTKAAIRGWQKRNGYPIDGNITEMQLVTLERELHQQQNRLVRTKRIQRALQALGLISGVQWRPSMLKQAPLMPKLRQQWVSHLVHRGSGGKPMLLPQGEWLRMRERNATRTKKALQNE